MKKKGLIISTIVMVVVLIASLTTATYAWFNASSEVKVNDEWVAFDNKNKDKILAQNPMNLEWRLNGDLLRKMGYTSGQTVEGQVITVDDKWGGLRLEIPMTIKIQ